MKKLILFTVILLNSIIASANIGGFKAFIPKGNDFVPVDVNIKQPSINDISKFLGYNSDQFYTYDDFSVKGSKVFIVVFKVFTDDIIFAVTEDTVSSINKTDVQIFLVDFNQKKEFGSYEIENTLADGVKNKSLSKKFLSEIFDSNSNKNDESIIAIEIGYELNFSNGVLKSYNTTDGLNKWGRMWKNELPSTYRKYLNIAKMYSDKQADIINEINIQADAFARTPQGVQNEYLKFHSNADGTVNYKMLLVAHYDEEISLSQFKKINIGRYELSTEFNNEDNYKRTTYRLNNTLYTFDENGNFVNSYSSN